MELTVLRSFYALHHLLDLIQNKFNQNEFNAKLEIISKYIDAISSPQHKLALLENIFQFTFLRKDHFLNLDIIETNVFIISDKLLEAIIKLITQKISNMELQNFRFIRFKKIVEDANWRLNFAKWTKSDNKVLFQYFLLIQNRFPIIV